MFKVLTERPLPPDFDLADDREAARHAAIALEGLKSLQGRMHWLATYGTDTGKLFGVQVVEDLSVLEGFYGRVGVTSPVKIHRVLRVLDPATAGLARG